MGPLTGIRVVEIASLAPAPFGCMMLADLGAEVVRVERLGGSGLAPPAGTLDRGRTTIAVDLKTAEGVRVVHQLARAADVIVEGFRPSVAERLGIGPEALLGINPRLVYGRMTGWGQDGPMASRAGHDINYVALAGLLQPLGRPGERPQAPMNVLGDFAGGGMVLAFGILAALVERNTSGRGQVVDAAMIDGSSLLTTFMRGMHSAGMWSEERGTNPLDGAAPFYDTYETSDGRWMAVGCVEPAFYALMIAGLGLTDVDLAAQHDPDEWPADRKRIAGAFLSRTRDEWAEAFADSDACVTPVLSPWEAHEHPHHVARGAFVKVSGHVQPAPAPRFDRTPARTPRAMDADGRDPAQTLRAWGFDDADVATLTENGDVA